MTKTNTPDPAYRSAKFHRAFWTAKAADPAAADAFRRVTKAKDWQSVDPADWAVVQQWVK